LRRARDYRSIMSTDRRVALAERSWPSRSFGTSQRVQKPWKPSPHNARQDLPSLLPFANDYMGSVYFPPVCAMLSTKYFCSAKKRMTQGAMQTTLAAMSRLASVTPYWPEKVFNARASVRLAGLFR
jgi:hypothetical protein